MASGKFLNILHTMPSSERKAFLSFLQSPYPNSTPILVQLYELILSRPDNVPLDRESLWNELYAEEGRPYRDDHMRKHLSDLAKQAEQFFLFETVRKKPEDFRPQLMAELRERNLEKYFTQHFNRYEKSFAAQYPQMDGWEAWKSFELEWENYLFNMNKNRIEFNRDRIQQLLTHSYLIFQLRFLMEGMIQQQMRSEEGQLENTPILQELLRQPSVREHPVVKGHLLVYELMQVERNGPEWRTKTEEVTRVLYALEAQIGVEPFAYPLGVLLNLIIPSTRARSEDREFFEDQTLKLYDFMIRRRQFHRNGYLIEWHFKNNVTLLLVCGKHEKARKFIENFRSQLDPAVRENVVAFNLGHYFYSRANYSEALKQLQRVTYDDPFYSLDARSLTMKVYLETESLRALDSFLDTFKRFLDRSKAFPKARMQLHLNRLKYVRKLFRIIDQPFVSQRRLLALRKKVKEEPVLFDKAYLLKRIDVYLDDGDA